MNKQMQLVGRGYQQIVMLMEGTKKLKQQLSAL